MASDNLHPLEELKRLDQQVEEANQLAALSPIFQRLDEIAKQFSGDFEVQLVVGDVKQHVLNRGTKLKEQNETLPEPPALEKTAVHVAPPPPAPPSRPASPPTVVMQSPFANAPETPVEKKAEPPAPAPVAQPVAAPPPSATAPSTPPAAPPSRPASPPTVVMQSPFANAPETPQEKKAELPPAAPVTPAPAAPQTPVSTPTVASPPTVVMQSPFANAPEKAAEKKPEPPPVAAAPPAATPPPVSPPTVVMQSPFANTPEKAAEKKPEPPPVAAAPPAATPPPPVSPQTVVMQSPFANTPEKPVEKKPEPPPVAAAPPIETPPPPVSPPTVVMQSPFANAPEKPVEKKPEPPPVAAAPPAATPSSPVSPPTVVMQSPFANAPEKPGADKLPEDLQSKRLISSGQFSPPAQPSAPLAGPPKAPEPPKPVTPIPDAPTVVMKPGTVIPDAPKSEAPKPQALRPDTPTVVIRPDAKKEMGLSGGDAKTPPPPVPPTGGSGNSAQAPPPPSRPNWTRALGIGALVGLLLAGIGVGAMWYFSEKNANPMDGAVPVQIATTPAGASIRINGEPNCTSDCTASLPPGTYRIEASLDGYEPLTNEITVEAGSTPTLNLPLTPLPMSVRILADLPQGTVTVDGQPAGMLQDGQLVIERVAPGLHTVAVTSGTSEASFGFNAAEAKLPVVAGTNARNLLAVVVASFANQARVLTSSGPMKLTVNGQAQGDASPEGVDLANYQAGVAEMVLGEGAQARTLQENFGAAPMITAFLKSDANTGTLIVATGESDVRVFLNDKEYTRKTARGVLRVPTLGRVTVRVAKDGFEDPMPQTVTVAKGSETRVTFNMKALPEFSTLDITGGTAGAEVLIDGNVIGTLSPTTGSFRNRSIEAGARVIELRRAGYQPKRLERTFRRGQTVTLAGQDAVLAAETKQAPPPPPPPAPKAEPPPPPKVSAAPKPRTGTMANFDAPEAWREEEGVWRHRGAAHLTYGITPANGVFAFTIHRLRGGSIFRAGRVRWMIQYKDARNYSFYEMDDETFWSKVVQDGKTLERSKVKHGLDKEARSWPIQVDLSPQAAVIRAQRNGEWVVLDRWAEPGRNFTEGKFGILVQGNDEVGLTDFRFTGR